MSNEARKQEAADAKTAVVKFREHEFTIDLDVNEWTLEMHEALEDGKELSIMRAALGPKQWAVVRAMGLKTPGLTELSVSVAEALGFKSVGESPASSD